MAYELTTKIIIDFSASRYLLGKPSTKNYMLGQLRRGVSQRNMETPVASDIQIATDIHENQYKAILEEVATVTLSPNDRVSASFHFIRYHDCVDREKDFLNILKRYIIHYCFPKEKYTGKTPEEYTDLTFEARDKFFNPSDPSKSGELGEIALYFLLESFLKAPQVVSKMALKTTGNENYKGSDGVHIGKIDSKLCVFYCESKLNKVRDTAFQLCIDSVLDFHEKRKGFEISIVNNHIDIADPILRDEIKDFINPIKPKRDDIIEVNACFIGFNWNKFVDIEKETENNSLQAKLNGELLKEIEACKSLLLEKIKYPDIKHRFLFFVIPFKDVKTLRENFLALLYGRK